MKQNQTALTGLFIFVIGLPLLACFFCGPCQQFERRHYVDGPYRLPNYERPVEEPRADRIA